jgi:hypothetical protein
MGGVVDLVKSIWLYVLISHDLQSLHVMSIWLLRGMDATICMYYQATFALCLLRMIPTMVQVKENTTPHNFKLPPLLL